MPNTTKPLTNTEIKQAKPSPKEYNLADGGGLALRVKPNGSKLWIFNYSRPHSKKRANISFGNYPALSLSQARCRRDEALALLAKEIDPKAHKEQEVKVRAMENANTLEGVAKQWFDVKKTEVSTDFAQDIWRSLELHLFPTLGDKPIHQLDAPTVIATLKPIEAKGSYETIRRLCQRINELMVFATNTGLIQHNPLAGIKAAFQAPAKNHMPTIKPEQLPELIHTLNGASIKATTRHLINWQLHTMTRPSEAAGARWEEVDTNKELWNIPSERMKKGKPHSIPLTPQTLDILEAMRPVSGHLEFIFPAGRNPKKHINESTANVALKRMGYHGRLVAHGLRALASTTLNEQGFDPDIIEAALAHQDKNEVRRAYNRAEYLERRRAMMRLWSEHIEQATIESFTNRRNIRQLKSVS